MVDTVVAELGVGPHLGRARHRRRFLERLRELVAPARRPGLDDQLLRPRHLMQAVHAAGYRVSMSGTAADELFAGYYDHHLAYLRRAP